MPISDDQIATLRALLAGRTDEYRQLLRQLEGPADKAGYTALTTASFLKAADRRFANEGTATAVTEFVADIRARSAEAAEEIDPSVAELVIRAAISDEDVDDLDSKSVVNSQMILLAVLINDEQLDDEGLEAFLADARKLAEQIMD